MGKCVRIHRSSKHPSPSSAGGEAAAYLTLRSGRRVPVSAAACSSPPGSRHRRGSSACRRRCGAKGRACGSPGRRRKSTEPSRAVLGAPLVGGGGGPEEEGKLPSQASLVAGDVVDGGRRDDSSKPNTPLAGDAVRANHEQGSKSGVVAGKRSPVLEAEMEAFFSAAELAERRRFAAAYNYDVALDCPLEGRFEWAPVNT